MPFGFKYVTHNLYRVYPLQLGPVTVYACLQITGLERFYIRVFLSIAVIVSGCVVAAYGEVHLSVFGLTLICVGEINEVGSEVPADPGVKASAFKVLIC